MVGVLATAGAACHPAAPPPGSAAPTSASPNAASSDRVIIEPPSASAVTDSAASDPPASAAPASAAPAEPVCTEPGHPEQRIAAPAESCAAACAYEKRDGYCFDHGACAKACSEHWGRWTSAERARFACCVRTDPLCYRSIDDCVSRR